MQTIVEKTFATILLLVLPLASIYDRPAHGYTKGTRNSRILHFGWERATYKLSGIKKSYSPNTPDH
jgi:hypothetical protein